MHITAKKKNDVENRMQMDRLCEKNHPIWIKKSHKEDWCLSLLGYQTDEK